jgi:hypothetical protein
MPHAVGPWLVKGGAWFPTPGSRRTTLVPAMILLDFTAMPSATMGLFAWMLEPLSHAAGCLWRQVLSGTLILQHP